MIHDLSHFPQIEENHRVCFPPSDEGGDVIGSGGNLSPGVLLSAYEQGMFPWYSPDEPILWWCPDPRFVIYLDEFHISRRNRRAFAKRNVLLTTDRDFSFVIRSCASTSRYGQKGGSWIGADMIRAYRQLYHLGYAHSIEVWEENMIIGGLYGVGLGEMFFGESMFSLRSGASSMALVALVHFLKTQGVTMIDSQMENPHIKQFGGRNISRDSFLEHLNTALNRPGRQDWKDFHCWGQSLSL